MKWRYLAMTSVIGPVACNALLGTEDPRMREETDAGVDGSTDAGVDGSTDAGVRGCAHSCLGGACVAGKCQPVALASEMGGTPNEIVADPGTTGSIFWTRYRLGQVIRQDKATWQMQTLRTAEFQTDWAQSIAANETTVFWTSPDLDEPIDDRNNYIGWISRDGTDAGKKPGRPYGDGWYPWPMALDPQYVYWSNRWTKDIWRMDIATKTPERLGVIDPDGSSYAIAISPSAGGYVFWVDGRQVFRMDKNGHNVFRISGALGTGDRNTPPLGLNGSYLYWIRNDALVREDVNGECPDASECPETVVKAGFVTDAHNLAFDATYVYWTEYSAGRVKRARKDDHALEPEVLVEGVRTVHGIAVDDLYVYFTQQFGADNDNQPGSVWRVAK
ncbi:MAG TPA: hypothetical protein VNO21_20710 [Polyangiaceae bacterium]|nr:hypothetical protein [Polyangiaceae bacterium]